MTITMYKENIIDPMDIDLITLENVSKIIVTPECLEVYSRGTSDIYDNEQIKELVIKRK